LQKILTINVPFTAPWALPYGSAVVNGILDHHGYQVKSWDLSIDTVRQFRDQPEYETFQQVLSIGGYVQGIVSKSFLRKVLNWLRAQVRDQVNEHRPDIILLSVFSSQSVDFVIPLVSVIRDLYPDVYILVGGRGLDNIERRTQLNYGEYFATYLPVNATYLGDAENDLLTILEKRYQGCYVAQPVSATDLEGVPAANWNGIIFDNYDGFSTGDLRIPVTASKGCVRECTFCDVAGSWPKYIYRKGSNVGQEIVDLYRQTGMRKFEFTDNLINGSISNFRAMNQVIAEHIPNTIDYMGYAICRSKTNCPESDFELAAVAGAKLFKVGIETGSEKVRYDIKKKFTNDDIDWFTINCAKYNIKQAWLMFTGYPTETEEDFKETLKLLKEYSVFARQGLITVFLSLPMMLTSNSAFMRNYAIDYGLDHNKDDSWSDFFWTSTKHPENTFDVRVDRWRRFMDAIEQYGYKNDSMRQTEKFIELEGLEKIYNAKQTKKVIPITASNFNLN